jgi:RHS repeat-associated protein
LCGLIWFTEFVKGVLNSHLQSNTLELDDKAQTLSYEHYYPYGGTAIISGKDKTQVQQKRYRYTGKERDDNSGLCYYGARYLAPWLARWINPDAAGSIDGLNLYVYVGNNPLKYIDPTGDVKVIPADINLANYEIDVLSPIEGTYQNKVAFLLGLGFVFTSNDGSTTIRIIMFVTESLGFAAQFQGVGL